MENDIVCQNIVDILNEEDKFLTLSEIYDKYHKKYGNLNEAIIRKNIYLRCEERDLKNKKKNARFYSLYAKKTKGNLYGLISWKDDNISETNIFLKKGDIIDFEELKSIFCISGMGGIMPSNKKKCVVLVSSETKKNDFNNPYQDGWHDGLFIFTGQGRLGNQTLTGNNKTLYEAYNKGYKIYLLFKEKAKRYRFEGEIFVLGVNSDYIEKDSNGNYRKVLKFTLKLVEPETIYTYEQLKQIEEEQKKERGVRHLSDDQLRGIVGGGIKKPEPKTVVTKNYIRDQEVAEYAKRRADGKCELCGEDAPFIKQDGEPYLETHHMVRLSDGGPDTVYNLVALCPNCHRKIHSLKDPNDMNKLIEILEDSIKKDYPQYLDEFNRLFKKTKEDEKNQNSK